MEYSWIMLYQNMQRFLHDDQDSRVPKGREAEETTATKKDRTTGKGKKDMPLH